MKTHPNEDLIEQFVMGKLGADDSPAVAALETHLLACPECIEVAEETLAFVDVVRMAIVT